MNKQDATKRLEYLRGEIEAERISYGEIAELQSLVKYIDPDDKQLLEWAGVPEFPHVRVFDNKGKTWDRFTVVIYEDKDGIDEAYAGVFGMSAGCDMPNGYNQYCGSVAENPLVLEALAGDREALKKLGHEVEFDDLPNTVKRCILARLAG